ncbi:MAG: cell division protein FtsA [Proteiniphilum sp.]|nr:cell division protein FtsA [Proteiniphilum sp.]MDD2726284.1 cell division protein FtsA [Proteiniphilum sp.]MDD3331605.1 cell division protein FtsA [Proteiniphilum sp.]MDD3555712.1 cell division protein FtsA [Proteiniphilum sp.]MDD3978833.1 cell division protein FtsA [Proteiniphilum sp.]
MTSSGFTAVIDLGTSRIKGVMGRRNENGVISVITSGSIDSGNSIRRGMVYNIEQVGANVHKLVRMMENSTGRKVGMVYVSLAGQSIHTMEYNEMKQLPGGMVTDEVVNQLLEAARKYQPDMKRNYQVADVEYYIDDKPERNPVGVTGSQIEAGFELIVGRPNLMHNIEKSIKAKSELEIAGYVVGPVASAAIALTDEEKELGCAFIDFGAGTTTLSVYKEGILRRMVVIPFGGRSITKDICALNFTENDAEQLKIKFGKAMETHEGPLFTSPFSSKPDIDLAELNKVIGMRLDEIIANIREQISLSGYEEQLGAGVVITGGASQLKNLDLYLGQQLKMEVRKATARKTMINNAPELTGDPSYALVLGMLLSAKDDCEQVVVEIAEEEDEERVSSSSWPWRSKPEKEKKGKKEKVKKVNSEKAEKSEGGFLSKMEDMFGNIFSEDDE